MIRSFWAATVALRLPSSTPAAVLRRAVTFAEMRAGRPLPPCDEAGLDVEKASRTASRSSRSSWLAFASSLASIRGDNSTLPNASTDVCPDRAVKCFTLRCVPSSEDSADTASSRPRLTRRTSRSEIERIEPTVGARLSPGAPPPNPLVGTSNASGSAIRLSAMTMSACSIRREKSARKSVDTSTSASVTCAGDPIRTFRR